MKLNRREAVLATLGGTCVLAGETQDLPQARFGSHRVSRLIAGGPGQRIPPYIFETLQCDVGLVHGGERLQITAPLRAGAGVG